jgi:peptide deformylase
MTQIAAAEIVKIGHPVLRKPAWPVSSGLRESAAFDELIEIMKLTLRGRGVGLAAPQIGVGLRVFVMEDPRERVEADRDAREKERAAIPFEVVINPAWRPVGEEMKIFMEGCLSIPGLLASVPRHRVIEAEWTAIDGSLRKETLRGWPARIFQHESDHLDGRLYLDYLEDHPSVSYPETGKGVSDDLLTRLGLAAEVK